MLLAIALLLLPLQPARPFAEERHLLDRRLEALRRVLPDGANPAADTAVVRDLALAAGLTQVTIDARPPLETGSRGDVVLGLTALGGYEETFRFFEKLSLSHRLVDVEELALAATTEDVSRVSAVLKFPYWPARAPLPPPPDPVRGLAGGVARPVLDAYRRDLALAYAKSDAVAERRRTRRSARLFLSELAAASRQRAVLLGYASLGEEFAVRGIALGEGPLRAFESRMERGFFRVSEFLIARQGACHRFEVRGRSPVAGPDAELPIPVEDPFAQEASPCRVDRDASSVTVVKGRAPTARDPGKGPLTMRLRDVDLADVFQVLAHLGLGGYVVDEAVARRVSVEMTRATLDDLLAALRKVTGVVVADAGPVRRVCVAAPQPAHVETPAGGPVSSFWLKRADARDLLAAMAEVEPTLASLGPPGFLGRVSVFTRDVPLYALRAAVLDGLSLSERREEEQRVLERRTGAGEPPVPVVRSGPDSRLVLPRDALTVREFDLVGVASAGAGFVALVYSPTGQLNVYATGDRLGDGVVRSVDVEGVVIETESGPVGFAVAPLAN